MKTILKLIYLLIIITIFTNHLYSQNLSFNENVRKIISVINEIRNERSIEKFSIDSVLSDISFNHATKFYNDERIVLNKKEIRNVLREKHRYDYHISNFSFHLEEFTNTSIKKYLTTDKTINNIILNPLYNKLGIGFYSKDNKNIISLLFTQSFIEFNKTFERIILFSDGETENHTEYVIIRGKSPISELYYQTCNTNEPYDLKSNLIKREKLLKDGLGLFELKIDVSKTLAKRPNSIVFLDSSDKILALILF